MDTRKVNEKQTFSLNLIFRESPIFIGVISRILSLLFPRLLRDESGIEPCFVSFFLITLCEIKRRFRNKRSQHPGIFKSGGYKRNL